MTDDTTLHTIEDVIDRLKLSRPSIYRLLNDGALRSVVIGSRRFVYEKDLRAFIEAHRAPPPKGG